MHSTDAFWPPQSTFRVLCCLFFFCLVFRQKNIPDSFKGKVPMWNLLPNIHSFIHSFIHFLPPPLSGNKASEGSPVTSTLQKLMTPSQISSCLISLFALLITPSSLKQLNCLPGNHTSFLVFLLALGLLYFSFWCWVSLSPWPLKSECPRV